MSAGPPVLELARLEVGHGQVPILPPLTLTVRPGELWAVIGPNGGGKSTLVRTALGLLAPLGGTIRRTRSVAYVAQSTDWDTGAPARARDVVLSGVDRGWSFLVPGLGWRARARVRDALHATGAAELARKQVSELSGGQRQRVALARAVASSPDLLVLDEPTSSLDVRAEQSTLDLLEALRRDRGLGIVLVTHALGHAADYATHALLLDKDHALALAGPVGDVVDSEPFVTRFGAVARRAGVPA